MCTFMEYLHIDYPVALFFELKEENLLSKKRYLSVTFVS